MTRGILFDVCVLNCLDMRIPVEHSDSCEGGTGGGKPTHGRDTMTTTTMTENDFDAIDRQASTTFRSRFEDYKRDGEDIGSALEDAKKDACAHIPDGVTGTFDDETLTFRSDR